MLWSVKWPQLTSVYISLQQPYGGSSQSLGSENSLENEGMEVSQLTTALTKLNILMSQRCVSLGLQIPTFISGSFCLFIEYILR